MEHDRELLAALVQNRKDMKSLRDVVDALRSDLQELTTAIKNWSNHIGQKGKSKISRPSRLRTVRVP
jgi:hypothetical protein